MSNNDVLTGAEIVEICNKYPKAKVSFENRCGGSGIFGTYISYVQIRGYKINKDSDGNIIEIIFVEDSVIPRSIKVDNPRDL